MPMILLLSEQTLDIDFSYRFEWIYYSFTFIKELVVSTSNLVD
jgi:hypothetical protein